MSILPAEDRSQCVFFSALFKLYCRVRFPTRVSSNVAAMPNVMNNNYRRRHRCRRRAERWRRRFCCSTLWDHLRWWSVSVLRRLWECRPMTGSLGITSHVVFSWLLTTSLSFVAGSSSTWWETTGVKMQTSVGFLPTADAIGTDFLTMGIVQADHHRGVFEYVDAIYKSEAKPTLSPVTYFTWLHNYQLENIFQSPLLLVAWHNLLSVISSQIYE